jgi:hypothetical protein
VLDARLLTDLAALLSELALATRTDDGRALVLDDRLRDVHNALDVFGCGRDALVSRVNRAAAMMDALRRELRDLRETHELAIAELSRPLAEREAELRAALGADDVDAVIADRDDAIRRADASEARLRLVGDAVAALVEVARG